MSASDSDAAEESDDEDDSNEPAADEKEGFPCDLCGQVFPSARSLPGHRGKGPCQRQQRLKLLLTESADQSICHLLMRLRKTNRIMRRIPKAARSSVTELFTRLLKECLQINSVESWKKLLCFPYVVLNLPPRPKGFRRESLTTVVKRNAASYSYPPVNTLDPEKPSQKDQLAFDVRLKRDVEVKLQDGNIRGAVRVLCSDDVLAPHVDSTLTALRSKHPSKHRDSDPVPPPDSSSAAPVITVEEVMKAVNGFPNGSAGGWDGLRPQHLKDLLGTLRDATAGKLAATLAQFADMVVKGSVPPFVRAVFFGASLTALKKKDGGIRPIAVGCTLRRLVAKVISSRVCEDFGSKLRPIQLGYGTAGGAEAAVHAVRNFLDRRHECAKVMLKLDFRNAFNLVRRDRLLAALKEHVPKYYSFFHSAYGYTSSLLYSDTVIESQEGVQQGDPLGPMCYCLGIEPMTSALSSELNVWYMDDGTLAGDPEVVLADLKTIIQRGTDYGAFLNVSKCEMYLVHATTEEAENIEAAFRECAPEIRVTDSAHLELLGSPLTDEGIPLKIDARTADLRTFNTRLSALRAHHGLFLLKSCLSIPKLLYLLRTAPTWKCLTELENFDSVLRSGLQSILNILMTDNVWRQSSLPARNGGLGIRRAAQLCLPAYLASLYASGELAGLIASCDMSLEVEAAEDAWKSIHNEEIPVSNRNMQKIWDVVLVKRQFDQMVAAAGDDIAELARILAVATKEAGGYLNAVPVATVGNFMDDETLRIAVALRLGAPLCRPYVCRCGTQVDGLGRHGLDCPGSASERIARHNTINDIIKRTFSGAGIPARVEPRGLSVNSGKRPDGLTLIPFREGKQAMWDVVVTNTVAASYVDKTSKNSGAAAVDAEIRKERLYDEFLDSYCFIPLAFETLGSWGPSAYRLVSSLGRKLYEVSGEIRSSEYLKQRISVELQRGNAACIFSSLPKGSVLSEIFDLV